MSDNGAEVPPINSPPRSCLKKTAPQDPQSVKDTAAAHVAIAFNPQVEVAPDILFEPPYVAEDVGTVARLYDEVQKRDEKLKAKREQKEKEEQEALEALFKPSLSKIAVEKGKRWNSFDEFIDSQLKWKKDRAAALDKKMAMNQVIADSQRPDSEQMSKVTKKIVTRMEKEKRYQSPIKGWRGHFENFLLKQAGMSMPTETTRRSASPTYAPYHSFAPTISSYAQDKAEHDQSTSDNGNEHNQSHNGTVFDRLYDEHRVRQMAQKVLAESYIESVMGGNFAPSTNEHPSRFYDPSSYRSGEFSTSSSIGGPRHPDVVVDTLLSKGQAYEEKKAHLRSLKESSKEVFSFKPETNPNSKRILKAFAMKSLAQLEEERMERGGNVRSGLADDDELPAGVRGIHRPKKAAKFDVEKFQARLERHRAVKEANLKAIADECEFADVKECSFRPALTKAAIAPHSRSVQRLNRRPDGLLSAADHLSIYSASSPHSAARQRGDEASSMYSGHRGEDVSLGLHRSGRSVDGSQPTVAARTPIAPTRVPKPASPRMHHSHPQMSPPRGETYSGVSSTASVRHHHNHIGDGDLPDAATYLANLEAEMEQVLSDWRDSTAP